MKIGRPPEDGEWIGCDLDGTLADDTDWRGAFHIGKPVPAMVVHIKELLEEGWEVRIFTARVAHPATSKVVRHMIEDWTEKHIGTQLKATCEKDYGMLFCLDDRVYRVERNTGKILGYIEKNEEDKPGISDGTGVEWRVIKGTVQHRFGPLCFTNRIPGPWITTENAEMIEHPARKEAIELARGTVAI